MALAPQLSPLVGLPGSPLLAPAHTDVLPAASGEVQGQLRHLGMGEQKGSSEKVDVCIPVVVRVTHLNLRLVVRQLVRNTFAR